MLIMMSVVLAASTLQAAGGMDYLIKQAGKLLRRNPRHITFMAPLVAWIFTFVAGTGNVLYNVLPVIAEVAHGSGIRPERPISISVIASQHAVTSSPVSAATVALAALLAPFNVSVLSILAVVIPSTLAGIMAGALVVCKMGKELKDDPIYLEKLRNGELEKAVLQQQEEEIRTPREAKLSVGFFLLASIIIVLMGTVSWLRPEVANVAGKISKVSMTHMIEVTMLCIAGLMVLFCKADVNKIISNSVFRAGMMGIVTVFGLAWMSDTLIANNLPMIKMAVSDIVKETPSYFAFALFFVSALTHSQGATVGALMPLGIALDIPSMTLVAMFPAVCGYFLIPSTGVLLAGVAFDRTGTTKIGKYAINHSYIVPGFVATIVSVLVGMGLSHIFF
jgi:anaerobic C4-dicarboxylate transporter-like protein